MPRRFLASLLVVLAGCFGTQTDPTRFFVLAPVAAPAGAPAAAAPPTLGLGPVKLPDYLDQTAIVTRTTEHEVDYLSYARWAERLSPMVSRVLGVNLSARAGGRERWLSKGDWLSWLIILPRSTGNLSFLSVSSIGGGVGPGRANSDDTHTFHQHPEQR